MLRNAESLKDSEELGTGLDPVDDCHDPYQTQIGSAQQRIAQRICIYCGSGNIRMPFILACRTYEAAIALK